MVVSSKDLLQNNIPANFSLHLSNKRQSEVEVTDRQIHIRDVGSILD